MLAGDPTAWQTRHWDFYGLKSFLLSKFTVKISNTHVLEFLKL